MNRHEIEAVEREIAQAKATIEFGKAVERLKTNSEFKKVVLDGYFRDEAVRLVHLKGDPAMQTMEKQDSVIAAIDAIAGFSGFLNTALAMARMAEKALESNEEVLTELQAEELNRG
jgi:hypothetical protein